MHRNVYAPDFPIISPHCHVPTKYFDQMVDSGIAIYKLYCHNLNPFCVSFKFCQLPAVNMSIVFNIHFSFRFSLKIYILNTYWQTENDDKYVMHFTILQNFTHSIFPLKEWICKYVSQHTIPYLSGYKMGLLFL